MARRRDQQAPPLTDMLVLMVMSLLLSLLLWLLLEASPFMMPRLTDSLLNLHVTSPVTGTTSHSIAEHLIEIT